MTTTTGVSRFGAALAILRRAAGLTQEQLAERAGLSVRTISDLERDIHRAPRRVTLDLLVAALGLGEQEAAELAGLVVRHRRSKSKSSPPPLWKQIVTTVKSISDTLTAAP